jgi:putative Mn2+ efflux pump MntP
MDAFAVSITNGMCYRMNTLKNALYSGLAFGLFQGIMPLIGYFAGATFSSAISSLDHWIALVVLGVIGGKMIWEAVKEMRNPEACEIKAFSVRTLAVQAVATSIDALAVGVSLGIMQVDVFAAASLIAAITFGCSFLGVFIGKRFGGWLQDKAELLGGAILVLIGLKIFLEHMGVIAF